MTVTERFTEWAAGLTFTDVPEPARRAAARHLLDGVGTAIAARRQDRTPSFVAVAASLAGPPEACILGSTDRISAPAAAYANGALVHALDYDDTHAAGLVHATAVVLPAAFAVGEQLSASGEEVLCAAIVGYELVCRIAAAAPHGFHARGLHATQVAGVFAAAAVAAKLSGLEPGQWVNALGIAGSSAGGLLEFLSTGASTKQLHPGAASMNGILASRLAAAGATGPATVLEGPHGIYAALSARPSQPDAVAGGLGVDWEVTRITIKPYPACQLMHATLDATAAAVAAATRDVDPTAIEEVVTHVHPDSAAVVCEPAGRKLRPTTSYDAKFSLPWSVAALLIDGRLDIGSYSSPSLVRPEVAALAGRVRTVLTVGNGAAADAAGWVEIRMSDGERHRGEVEHSGGAPDGPTIDTAVTQKFGRNTGDSLHAPELIRRILALTEEPDLRMVLDLVATTAEQASDC